VVDFLFVIIKFFSVSLTRLRRYKRKPAEVGVFRRGGSLSAQILDGGASTTNHALSVSENESDCSFVWCQNIRSALFSIVKNHACDRRRDRQTDEQNYDSQDRASITVSCGKNHCGGWLLAGCFASVEIAL